jgi:hypothetical protein
VSKIAVALDELVTWLMSLPREEALRVLSEMPPTPVDLADQLDSATADAHRYAQQLIGDMADVGEAPGWARLGTFDALVRWMQDDSRTCMHNPEPLRPAPVYACAWKPGLIVCTECTHLLRAPNRTADMTCDGCGYVCASIEDGEGIHRSTFIFGPLTYLMGFCGRCLDEQKPETAA